MLRSGVLRFGALRFGVLRFGVRRPRREPPAAGGFTLIELVVSIAILGIVMTAFASIISTSLLVSGETERRLDASNALRRMGVTFTADVASSVEIVKDAADCTSGAGTALLELRGQSFDQPAVVTPAEDAERVLVTVTYEYADGTLTRVVCRDSAPRSGTPAATTVVESAAVATGLSAAHGTCTPDCANPNATFSLVLTPSGGTAQKLSATRRSS